MIPKIFIDMDGVVADFFTAALKAHGASHRASIWPKGVWNMEDVLGVTTSQFWETINKDKVFWLNLEVLEDGNAAYEQIVESNIPFCFLTSPSWHAQCYADKVFWVRDKLYTPGPVIPCPVSKAVCAAPGRLLIDDRKENIEEWEAAGGDSIFVPRPWNDEPENTDWIGELREWLADHAEFSAKAESTEAN